MITIEKRIYSIEQILFDWEKNLTWEKGEQVRSGRATYLKKEELDIEVKKPLSELVHKKVHSFLANGSRSNTKP